jgi:cyclohexa-1,5-dienecarbonyl-CoA hydratase
MADATHQKLEVRTTHDGQVLRIVLSSPPGNVLEGAMMAEIRQCLAHEGQSPALKAIVFEGKGKHFSFGASVAEHVKAQAPAMIAGFHAMFKDLLACEVPLVALVRGQCLGGALELAAFCHFVLAEPSAKLGQPEIQLAVLPPVAALILPDLVGQSRADDLVLTGRSIDAATAHAWGLVHAVCESAEKTLEEELLARHLLPRSARSLRLANRASRSTWYATLPARLDEMERLYVHELMETADANEGINAFLEKRSPSYTNR